MSPKEESFILICLNLEDNCEGKAESAKNGIAIRIRLLTGESLLWEVEWMLNEMDLLSSTASECLYTPGPNGLMRGPARVG